MSFGRLLSTNQWGGKKERVLSKGPFALAKPPDDLPHSSAVHPVHSIESTYWCVTWVKPQARRTQDLNYNLNNWNSNDGLVLFHAQLLLRPPQVVRCHNHDILIDLGLTRTSRGYFTVHCSLVCHISLILSFLVTDRNYNFLQASFTCTQGYFFSYFLSFWQYKKQVLKLK